MKFIIVILITVFIIILSHGVWQLRTIFAGCSRQRMRQFLTEVGLSVHLLLSVHLRSYTEQLADPPKHPVLACLTAFALSMLL